MGENFKYYEKYRELASVNKKMRQEIVKTSQALHNKMANHIRTTGHRRFSQLQSNYIAESNVMEFYKLCYDCSGVVPQEPVEEYELKEPKEKENS